jgi:flavin reductase (DIM6/NTAB) family NADH-FMN oxidoreductase RutF
MTADFSTTRTRNAPTMADAAAFREAMRHLPAGVCVISVGQGAERTGLTATSVSSLSAEPPTLLVSVNRASSSYETLTRCPAFGVNVLTAGHHAVADMFAGRKGVQGAERFAAGRWTTLESGVSVLSDAVAAFDCEVEERIERHTHAIIIGRVRALLAPGGPSALLYWRGQYDQLGWTEEEVARAVGLRPSQLGDEARPAPLALVK